jgi:hypothetical protein
MATNTTNFNLKKPAYSDTADIADINGNMDKVDVSLNGLADAVAIVANNNTHAAIPAGQFVYVHGHGSLAEGLYTAKSNIAANATLSTSNLQADGSGGLNALNSKTNYKTIQEFVFNQLNSNGEKSTLSPSSYPTVPGVYRTITSFAGLPSGANVYGALIIFNAGTYWVHIYVNAVHEFYFAYMGSAGTPTTWRKMTGTAVDPVT